GDLRGVDAEHPLALAAAVESGERSNLPGEGRPLELDESPLVTEALRAAYRILRNAGFVPPEVEACRERATLARMVASLDDEPARRRAALRLALIEARLEATGTAAGATSGYRGALLERLAR
ncbi:MAG TPA: DUF1992 domain-containing protein, partial [Casimicrobiaceae bacterium]|nr:DUF1992 domain-containing protein [Casimicrobiaceae bacterium]